MALGTIFTIMGIVGAAASAASAGYAMSGAGVPGAPNLGAGSAALINAEGNMLPAQRALQAAAEAGTSTTVWMPAHYEQQQYITIPGDLVAGLSSNGSYHTTPVGNNIPTSLPGSTEQINQDVLNSNLDAMAGGIPVSELGFGGPSDVTIPYNPSDWVAGGKYNPNGTISADMIKSSVSTRPVYVPAGKKTVDFTGLGAADIQSKLAKEMANATLGLQQKYDPQFIAEALREQKLANPEGVAARDKEYQLIENQIANHPDQPIADLLQQQIGERLGAGRGLDTFEQGTLDDAVARAQAARGGSELNQGVDYSNPMTTGLEGFQREMQGIGQANAWLGSGATPEDVEYRRNQQDMANLSSFASGQTPESQFGQMSAAGAGATPQYNGQPMPLMPTNQLEQAAGFGQSVYGTQLNNTANQPTWISGLSTAVNAGNSLYNSGLL